MCKRASLRNVDQLAVPTPGSVNRHHKNWNAAFELNAIILAVSVGHRSIAIEVVGFLRWGVATFALASDRLSPVR